MSLYTLTFRSTIKASLPEAWEFFSDPRNLEKITPPELNFKILNHIPETAYDGLIIQYTVTPLFGVKLRWVTEITHFRPPYFFVDEQRYGPYAFWHHQHKFEEIPGGVRVLDEVNYRIGFGSLDPIINKFITKPKICEIFKFRENAMNIIFQK